MNFQTLIPELQRQHARVMVLGMGISGVETAAFLCRLGLPVTCIERLSEEEYNQRYQFASRVTELRSNGVEVHFAIDGERVAPFLDGVALAVVSPGISRESAVVSAIKRRGIALATELEIGVQLFELPTIAVTGSNGKSTSVSLVQHMLQSCGKRSILCGNVGVPVVAGLDENWEEAKTKYDALVLEASSYQLEGCSCLKPRVGILLNLSDNHLERHGTMERYAEAKLQLFANQDKSDAAILNYDDERVRAYAHKVKGQVRYFGCAVGKTVKAPYVKIDYRPHEGIDRLEIFRGTGEPTTHELTDIQLLGLHNRYNIAAAFAALLDFGLPIESLLAALRTFQPLEHRLERVDCGNSEISIINDSKSTTVAASLAAVQAVADAYPEKRLTLLIGGLVKAGSWQPLMQELRRLKNRLNPVVCFGQDGRLLANHCEAAGVAYVLYPNLQRASEAAVTGAPPGDVVLLSPGSASFDEFTDFEHRGREFKGWMQATVAARLATTPSDRSLADGSAQMSN